MRTVDEIKDYFKTFLSKGMKHDNYIRVTKLADMYFAMVTGVGLNDMLQRIVSRETEDEFEQRKKLTKHVIPCIVNGAKMPFYKAVRKQPIVRKLDWSDTTNADAKKTELETYLNTYWGNKSIEEFLEFAYVDYSFVDPNAFILTDFDPFNPAEEKAKPYPVIINSKQAVDYKYKNEILQYLSIELPIQYIENGIETVGKQYTIFTGEFTYQFTQVSSNFISVNGEVVKTDRDTYELIVFNPKAKKVPAERMGYIKDYLTNGQTYLSVYHTGIPILEKTLKVNSELDLSMSMVAFPQRFAYTQPCTHDGCFKGELADGTTCPACNGTGIAQRHGSAADVMELPLPKSKDDMMDLSNLLHYANIDTTILEFDDKYLEKCKSWFYATIFNSEMFTRHEVSQTATEKILESDNLNDTLYPFGRKYSQLWEATVYDIATFTELSDGIILQHKFPLDFKLKTVTELMNDLKSAKDSGASSATIAAIEDDINEILYADRPDELQKIRVKNIFNPFRGFDSQRLAFTIGTNRTPKYYETLYLNLENIFQELEYELNSQWVYDLPINVIEGLVRAKVDARMLQLETEKPVVSFPNFEEDI